jgi:putative intracellular protease/amidase
MRFNFLTFNDFETLDLFGPVEVLGRTPDYEPIFLSMDGGPIVSAQGAKILTEPIGRFVPDEVLFLPGGQGTRRLAKDAIFLEKTRDLAEKSRWVLTVCTGSALLAKTGLLDGLAATSNKTAFAFAVDSGPKVHWRRKARWTVDGKFYASSGVSAGLDMSLGFIADRLSIDAARKIAKAIEYLWNELPDDDPFAALYASHIDGQ